MNLDKKVLEKIEKENIRMIPGWFFALKNLFLNACWVVAFLGSAVSFGMLLKWLNADVRLAMFWLSLFVLLLIISFAVVWRVNFRSLYKYGFASMIAFLSFSSALGFAIYSSRETGKVEVYIENIPAYKSISQENMEELNLDENFENQNVDLKSDELDPNLESNNETINGGSASDEDSDNDEHKEIESKRIIKEREINKETDEKEGAIEEKNVSKKNESSDDDEEEDDDDDDEDDDLIENKSQVKGVEKEQGSDEEKNKVKSQQEETAEIDADIEDEEE